MASSQSLIWFHRRVSVQDDLTNCLACGLQVQFILVQRLLSFADFERSLRKKGVWSLWNSHFWCLLSLPLGDNR